MNSIPFAFDATNIDPFVGGGGKAVPAGQYPMYISDLEGKANNNATSGHHLAVEYTIAEGEFKGTKVWDALNLWHQTSEPAVEIAQKKLSAICHAIGKLVIADITEIANIVHLVTVDLEPEKPEGVNPNTGEKIKGRAARNNVLRNDHPSTAAAKPAPNLGGSPVRGAPTSPMQAAATAAQQPAQQAPAQAAASPAANAAPPFTQAQQPAAQQAPATAAAAPAGPGGVPPWQR
jgi:hypothetical protein